MTELQSDIVTVAKFVHVLAEKVCPTDHGLRLHERTCGLFNLTGGSLVQVRNPWWEASTARGYLA